MMSEKKIKPWIYELIIFLIIEGIVLIVMTRILYVGVIASGSMEPTYKKNDLFLATRVFSNIEDGDVIVFRNPEVADGMAILKRVIASPGETIAVESNGDVDLIEEGSKPKEDSKVYTVPVGCYFVCGDNRGNSYDSRLWDDPFLPEQSIVAKLIFRKENHYAGTTGETT